MSHPSVARRRNRPRWREIVPPWNPERSVKVRTGLGLGGNESYPDLLPALRPLPGQRAGREGACRHAQLPGISFEGKSDLIKVMRELAA